MSTGSYKDPTDRRNKWRWQFASLLDRLPGTCWSNLVSWALGSSALSDVRQDYMCRTAAQCGRCYCNKIAVERTTQ